MEDNTNNSEVEQKSISGFKRFIYDWIFPIVLAIIATVIINKFLLFKIYIPSESMKPTLQVNDQLFVTRVYKPENLKHGDIIVFYSSELGDTLIKRLIGIPGDTVKIKGGEVYINNEKINEDYVKYPSSYDGEFKVPEGKFFFLGDNRANSEDARYWNNPFIDGKDIKGKAQLRVYPFNRFGFVK
ncbi:signal peptidase I [Clostridium sp. 'White wine YQ']|uniref:signal peptidase I n=1 Tax=Clostridium sp. 'White wine YQ' TaxID=3027474 RepID=UPI002366412E|nr:signal peptidase I [Clostridium sp. 'White wine YQ']MDD7795029.1 signal peptidase I [Clostridium sp. 'White wine YQ']